MLTMQNRQGCSIEIPEIQICKSNLAIHHGFLVRFLTKLFCGQEYWKATDLWLRAQLDARVLYDNSTNGEN